jgi:outer membrane protein OmpA-like peptidoglycan-associated protein
VINFSILLLPLAVAEAQERSADIEIVRPVLSPESPFGVDGLALDRPGTVRVGLFAQYSANPLVLEMANADELKVIGNRASAVLALSADVSERVGLRASLPGALSWGSDAPEYGADGPALGDLSGGVRVAFLKTDRIAVGAHSDLTLPSGTRQAWMSEAGLRLGGGLNTTLSLQDWTVSGHLGVLGRSPVQTDAQLQIGTEMYSGAGIDWAITEALAARAAAIGRFGFSPGSNAVEGLLGAQISPSELVSFDLMLGHGLTNGIGATDARLLGGVTVYRRPPAPTRVAAPMPVVIDDFTVLPEDEIEEEDEAFEEIPPETEWKPQELARVARGEVELRDPIRFQVGTAEILPESEGILEQVVAILASTPEIVHVVIVGHASNEGSFEVNYALSLDRAVSVYEALLQRGVHPDRLSVRAMGEVTPVGTTESEDIARRVEFRITRALAAGEQAPEYSSIDTLPFNGQKRPGGGGR